MIGIQEVARGSKRLVNPGVGTGCLGLLSFQFIVPLRLYIAGNNILKPLSLVNQRLVVFNAICDLVRCAIIISPGARCNLFSSSKYCRESSNEFGRCVYKVTCSK